MKTCTKCGEEKNIEEFHCKNSETGERVSRCKKCINTGNQVWVKNNPDEAKISNKIAGLKRRYNLSLERYNEMLIEQDHKCGICGRTKKLCVDHNHTTNEVRMLLCSSCNTHLGVIERRYDSFRNYLDKFSNISK